jgi:cytochrome b561
VLDLSNFRIWTRRSFASYTSLRWVTAVLVIVLWSIGQAIDFVPKGTQRTEYIYRHIVSGMLARLVLFVRLPSRMDRDYAVGRRVSDR